MSGREDYRIFIGGLSWDITERQLESSFSRFGKIVESQIMLERDTGRPRGFGFLTFADRRGMEDAIRGMHGQELGDKVISVNRAQPKLSEGSEYGHKGGYSSGGREIYGRGDRPSGKDDCFKCGRPGHWVRDCPSGGGGRGGGGHFPSRSRFGGVDDRGERFGGERDRYIDDRYNGGRYVDKERFDGKESKYGSRDHYVSDRYPIDGDRIANDRYAAPDRYPTEHVYGKDRGGYGAGGPPRIDAKSYRSRPSPYDRPSRGGRPSSYDRY